MEEIDNNQMTELASVSTSISQPNDCLNCLTKDDGCQSIEMYCAEIKDIDSSSSNEKKISTNSNNVIMPPTSISNTKEHNKKEVLIDADQECPQCHTHYYQTYSKYCHRYIQKS